ncbi:hypothetical protein [Sphingobacterium paludis]|nr:hypothetical protein [Sphingobacterium paludis]
MHKTYLITLSLLCTSLLSSAQSFSTDSLLKKIMPNNVKLQYAGNIGMFSTGFGYVSPNKRWMGDFMYGLVPSSYAKDPIHSLTLKGKYVSLNRDYIQSLQVSWLQLGLWFNYSFGDQYFLGLPSYYDPGYYYFPTALNIGLTLGSEVRYKKWGLYYELGTTEKRMINYVKNSGSINFSEIWNIGIGLVYHLK